MDRGFEVNLPVWFRDRRLGLGGNFGGHEPHVVEQKTAPNQGMRFSGKTAVFLWFGGADVLKHYVLRAVLGASGRVPWNLPPFLDPGRDFNLMQSVGSAYNFVHRRLLEHLAASGKERE